MKFDAAFDQGSNILDVEVQEQTQVLSADFYENSQDIVPTFEDDAELKAGFEGVQIISGVDVSASVEQTKDGAVITITDKDGTSTAKVYHGRDGQPGKDGLPGANGRDGQDGYTPIKGKDYFDGKDGKDGSPGKDGLPGEPGKDGLPGRDGIDGQDGLPGKDGQDGVSVEHRWIGTALEITSASGTSSVDLKGEPGKDGQPGANGQNGTDGYTPVKGKDYWTAADVQAMVSEAVAEVMKVVAPSKVDFNDGRFFAPAANVLYKPTTVSDTGITFQYKGGGGVEELYFPIVGLYPGRTYTIVFDETYNGGFIQDTYRYGCGIIQKSTYDSMAKPTTQAAPSWVAWHTGSTGKQSGSITFTANASVVYWGWSLGRLSDGKEVTINMNARVF